MTSLYITIPDDIMVYMFRDESEFDKWIISGADAFSRHIHYTEFSRGGKYKVNRQEWFNGGVCIYSRIYDTTKYHSFGPDELGLQLSYKIWAIKNFSPDQRTYTIYEHYETS